MQDKLKRVFVFLKENRQYNHALQERFYKSIITSPKYVEDKVISLLYHVANTQSQPKINSLAKFYKNLLENKSCLISMEKFLEKINPNQPLCFNSIYHGMKNQPGLGKKTAALFTKIIYHLHNGQYDEKLKIWQDVPKTIANNDDFYLPVDSVIIAIFSKLDSSHHWDFNKINRILKQNYSSQDIEIWDDLWFWGFVTQNGTGEKRIFEWNENKYWVLLESDKNIEMIEAIRGQSQVFLNLVTSKL